MHIYGSEIIYTSSIKTISENYPFSGSPKATVQGFDFSNHILLYFFDYLIKMKR